MPLTGGTQALAGFLRGIRKLPDAAKEIARELSPKVSELVGESFAAQASPTGQSWPATKSGEPAFGGSNALGYVLSRVVGKSVRTTVLYPLHFHQDGTHAVGRKRGREIARQITAGYVGSVLKQLGLKGSAPKRRKGESDEAYARRLEGYAAARTARSDAQKQAKRFASQAVEDARSAGGWHDPPRPMIPDEGDPIPASWMATIQATAAEVMARHGAVLKGA